MAAAALTSLGRSASTGARGAGAAPLPVCDVPSVVRLVGRGKDRENQDLQGEYLRISAPALVRGRPAYRKPGARTVIRYWPPADRWLIDRAGLQDTDCCSAYAEQGGALHPGREDLVWRVWETQHGQHVRDPELLATTAPSSVQVVGRRPDQENSDLNGEYQLVGLHQGRVAYRKASNPSHVIRYWPAGDRWLIDLDGLRDTDVCNAYADACGTVHPGAAGLSWHVWDTDVGRHVPDSRLASLAVPAVIELWGREAGKENVAMNGSYHLYGTHAGRPAYVKADGSGYAVRYWPRENRWLVDFQGLADVDVCNAYAEAAGSAEHPGDPALTWYVWDTARGRHLLDRSVRSMVVPHWVRVSGRDSQKENAAINGDYVLVGVVGGKAAYQKEGGKHAIRYWSAEDRWLVDLECGFNGGDVANAYADAKGADNPGNPELIWHVWDTSVGRHTVDEQVISESLRYGQVDWSSVAQAAAQRRKSLPTGSSSSGDVPHAYADVKVSPRRRLPAEPDLATPPPGKEAP